MSFVSLNTLPACNAKFCRHPSRKSVRVLGIGDMRRHKLRGSLNDCYRVANVKSGYVVVRAIGIR